MTDLPEARELVTEDRIDLAVRKQAQTRPTATALQEGESRVSYGDLEKMVAQAANWLSTGVSPKRALGVLMDNSIGAIVAILAGLRAGRIVVPINTKSDAATIEHICKTADIGLLLTTNRREVLTDKDALGTMVQEFDCENLSVIAESEIETERDDGPAIVFFTSGSTGKPKGVAASHGNLVYAADSVARYLSVTSGLRLGAVLPVSFDAGFNWVMTGLCRGAHVHLLRFVFPRSLASDISKHRVEVLLAVPTVFYALSQVEGVDGAQIKRMASTGGRMDATVVARLKQTYPGVEFIVMYGLTEAFRATYLPDALWDENPSSIGRAIPHADVRILSEEGLEALPGEVGEIVQSGPLVTLGYLGAPELMKNRFGPVPGTSRYVSSTMHAVYSGDYGYRDEKGLLYFVGRKDRMIKSRGFRIAPDEIEKAAVTHCGLDAVVAIGQEDPAVGQRIILVIEGDRSKTPSLSEIRDSLRPHIAIYMLPDAVETLQSFPLNANGKFDVGKISMMVTS